MFEAEKKAILERRDRSKKGSIDEGIRSVVDLLNTHPDYVTTSSCSGRIVLLDAPLSFDKKNTSWIYLSHSIIKENLFPLLEEKENAWLKMEGMILHVKCKTMEAAETFIASARSVGFKRCGAITVKKFPVVELTSSEILSVPVIVDGKNFLTEETLIAMVSIANTLLKQNEFKIDRLLHSLKKSI